MSVIGSVSTVGRRLGRALLVAWGVSLIAFAVMRLVPGDPVLVLLGQNASPEAVAQLRQQLNLNGSLLSQYVEFVSGAAVGDLGASLGTRQPVADTLQSTLPVTLWLTFYTLLIAIAIAIPLGLVAGTVRRGWIEQAFRLSSSAVLAIPVFVSGLVLLLLFSVRWAVFPVAGYEAGFPANLRYLALPAAAAAIPLAMIFSRIIATTVRDTSRQEFVETAIAWGLPRRTLWARYLVRPSVAPVIGLAGYVVGANLASAVILETVFVLPGVGTYLVGGVLSRDYPVVQGTILVFGLIIVVVHYLADVVAGAIDPRTRAL